MKKIVICDIDGTVANNDHRQHLLKGFKDWGNFFKNMHLDKPIYEVINLIKKEYEDGKSISFVTGRPERYRKETKKWLQNYFNFSFSLIMRNDKDIRNKIEIKRELFEENFVPSQIECCFENDLALIDLWEELGLRVINVNRVIIKS